MLRCAPEVVVTSHYSTDEAGRSSAADKVLAQANRDSAPYKLSIAAR